MIDDCVSARVKGYFCGGMDGNGEVVTIEECEKDNKELEIKFLRKRIEQLQEQLDKAVRYLELGKAQFAPNTTNSDVDDFIKRYKEDN